MTRRRAAHGSGSAFRARVLASVGLLLIVPISGCAGVAAAPTREAVSQVPAATTGASGPDRQAAAVAAPASPRVCAELGEFGDWILVYRTGPDGRFITDYVDHSLPTSGYCSLVADPTVSVEGTLRNSGLTQSVLTESRLDSSGVLQVSILLDETFQLHASFPKAGDSWRTPDGQTLLTRVDTAGEPGLTIVFGSF